MITVTTDAARSPSQATEVQPESTAFLSLEEVSHSYGGNGNVLKTLNLSIRERECICLLGPSGCGKTTTLNIIAGFIVPTAGRLMVNGRDLTRVPTHKRGFGMVFQGYALFPHMSVFENVAFGLRRKKVAKENIRTEVSQALDAVGLLHSADKYPNALSGGEAQRIGLARALAVRPRVLLLDEPLSNLDAKLRRQMQQEIRKIHDEFHLTSVYVTHDQEEAMILGDRVIVMNGGKIEQAAEPKEVYEQPVSKFVARFVGERNFIRGEVVSSAAGRHEVSTETGTSFHVRSSDSAQIPVGQRATLAILEERVSLAHQPQGNLNEVEGTVAWNSYRGGRSLIGLRAGTMVINIQVAAVNADSFRIGQAAWATMPEKDIVLLPGDPGPS